jgi:hypothetical protein
MLRFIASTKHVFWGLLGSLALAAAPAGAQELESIDPDAAYGEEIDGDLAPAQEPQPATTTYGYAAEPDAEPYGSPSERTEAASTELPPVADTADAVAGEPAYQGSETTYGEDDLIDDPEPA